MVCLVKLQNRRVKFDISEAHAVMESWSRIGNREHHRS